MIRALALRALRLYPGTWRMRYEEEVRALLEDAPPGAGQVLELLRGAATEWIHAFADPAAHPGAAAVLRMAFGWVGAYVAVQLLGVLGGLGLQGLAGQAPSWAGVAAAIVVLAQVLRCTVTLFTWDRSNGPINPLRSGELRVWWTTLVVGVVLGNWADGPTAPLSSPMVPLGIGLLLTTSTAAWRRTCARRAWMRIREQHRDRVRRYAFLATLVARGLATRGELAALGRDVTRAGLDLDRAAAELRASGLRRLPPRHPLGLDADWL